MAGIASYGFNTVTRPMSPSGLEPLLCLPSDDYMIPPVVSAAYPNLPEIIGKTSEGIPLMAALVENGFCPFPVGHQGDPTVILPIHVSAVGGNFLLDGSEYGDHERADGKFYGFSPLNEDSSVGGITFDQDGNIVGLTDHELDRLTILSARYFHEGYLQEQHLSPVVTPEGIRCLYVDAFTATPGCQFSMRRRGLSLRVVLPLQNSGAHIIDRFEDDSVLKSRLINQGELPLHTLLPEHTSLPTNLVTVVRSWIRERLGEDTIHLYFDQEGFLYRKAMRDLGLVLEYREGRNSSNGEWIRVLPYPVTAFAELSQFASDGESSGNGDFLHLGTGLLIPFVDAFNRLGYYDYLLREHHGMRAAYALSAVPGMARMMRFGSKFIPQLEYVQIGPVQHDCLNTDEVPALLVIT